MELYIDESGNTGCVITNGNKFNFKKQRHFVLCAIKVESEREKNKLVKKYRQFKKKFNIEEEIKGSDLMTRKYNDELKYFIDNILDDSHFKICIYDKKFYLATLLLLFILGYEFQTAFSVQFYFLAAELCFYGEELLIEYCELVKKPTPQNFEKLLKKIVAHEYVEIPHDGNPLIMMANKILEDKEYECWIKDILSYGCYDNPRYVNVINLNCLSELIITLKWQENLKNSSIQIHHDKIYGYDKAFLSELEQFDVNLDFVDSEEEELVQLADNAVSIFAKCVNEAILRIEEKRMWDSDSRWIMEQYSKVINKVDINNIKFTIPLQNWASSLCVKEMFRAGYSIKRRNNLFFNDMYKRCMDVVIFDTDTKNFDVIKSLNLLKQ